MKSSACDSWAHKWTDVHREEAWILREDFCTEFVPGDAGKAAV